MAKRDLYAVLGVRETATGAEVKRAYLRLAKKLHPDVNRSAGAHEKFLAVKEAYETLSNPLLRREYDDRLHAPVPDWAEMSRPRPGPSRVIRVTAPYGVRETRTAREARAVRVRPPSEDRRRRQLQFAYTAVTASVSVVMLAGSFLLVAAGGVLPGVVSFLMGLTLVLLLLHVFPFVRLRSS